MANYDGLTRNTWTGTWSPSGTHPIVLDTEIRGGLRYASGDEGDRLEDIPGQRLQEGMLVYLKNGYSNFSADKYYKYILLEGESRDLSTGEMPNNAANWSEVLFGSSGGGGGGGNAPDIEAGTGINLRAQGNAKVVSLTDTGVVAGEYGSAESIPILTVDQQGRIVSVKETLVSNRIARIEVLGAEELPLTGLVDTIPFTDHNIKTVVSYFAKDNVGTVVSLDATISDSDITFSAKEDLSNFDITLTYVFDEYAIKSNSYKYNLSGNSYALKHNGINNLINFYVLDPDGNVVDIEVNVGDSDLTVESSITLDGHSLYVISN